MGWSKNKILLHNVVAMLTGHESDQNKGSYLTIVMLPLQICVIYSPKVYYISALT